MIFVAKMARSFMALGLFAGLFLTGGMAYAVTVPFERITGNSSADAASQLLLDATDDTANNRALLSFSVVAGPNPGANIAEIYFSDLAGLFAPPPSVVSATGNVSFETGVAQPGNVPGANNASPPFVTTDGLLAQADGNNATGVSVGESIVLGLTYIGGADFLDLLTALGNGDFRIALHVRSLLGGTSDSFVSTPPGVVPLPAGGLLLLTGLGALGWIRRDKPTVVRYM